MSRARMNIPFSWSVPLYGFSLPQSIQYLCISSGLCAGHTERPRAQRQFMCTWFIGNDDCSRTAKTVGPTRDSERCHRPLRAGNAARGAPHSDTTSHPYRKNS